ERDIETNYDYFGARYYNSKIGLWNSVDPLADKYPGISPYTYCVGNPLRLVDPNGEEIFVSYGEHQFKYSDGKMWNSDGSEYTGYLRGDGFWDSIAKFFGNNYKGYVGDVFEYLQSIENGGSNGNRLISDLVESTDIILVRDFSTLNGVDKIDNYDPDQKSIYWQYGAEAYGGDADGKKMTISGNIALAHELGHAWDGVNGTINLWRWLPFDFTRAENTACGIENLIRAEHDLKIRGYYGIDKQGEISNYNFPPKKR
ncbi:MAG: RHS repeat-associated core domain-containing protein, partial [bacterium]